MGLLISKTDFINKYEVAQNNLTSGKLDEYIARYEKKYLRELLGVELYDLFVGSFASGLPTGIYLTLYEEINADDGTCVITSKGIKKMLLGFVYFEYYRDQKVRSTNAGPNVGNSELNREAAYDESNIYQVYNESINDYQTIQWYIEKNLSVYPKYNGQPKKVAHWSI